MSRMMQVLGAMVLSATVAAGAVYMVGEILLKNNDCTVDIVKMSWGRSETEGTDLLVGLVRLYVDIEDAFKPVRLFFDVDDRNNEKISSFDITFDFTTFGFRENRLYLEGEFYEKFPHPKDSFHIKLVNTQFDGESVKYKTSFNISNSLTQSLFKVRKPRSRR